MRIENVARDIPSENECPEADSNQKETPEIYFAEIFRIEKKISKPVKCSEIFGDDEN